MKVRFLLLALPPAIGLTFRLPSSSRGIYFPGVTQSTPACGACHNGSPGAAVGFQPIRITLQPTARVLDASQSIQIALSATGGQSASTNGGFAMDTTAGTFSAGANTRVVNPGDAITHSNSNQRSWTFGYTAPAAPGLVELATVVNTVNDDHVNNNDDMWAFHGFDDAATQVTPVRLFVNAPGVVALGTACSGSYGNVPVLGSATAPTVGNAAFALALHGAAPASVAGLFLGVTPFPAGLDLGIVGVTGCSLFVDPLITVFGATSPGDALRGEGTTTFAVPIANNPGLRGGILHFQAFVLDVNNGRPTPLTMTNGITATIQ